MDLNISSAQDALTSMSDEQILQNGKSNATAANALAQAKSELLSSNHNNTPTSSMENKNGANLKAERMQLINEEQAFNQDFNSFLNKWDLEDAGFGYNLCAVLGQ